MFEILSGQKSANVLFTLQNRSDEPYQVHAVLENSAGKNIREKQLTVPAGKTETLTFSLTPTERILDRYRLRLSYDGKYASHSAEKIIYVRTHGTNNGKINVGKKRMDGYDKEVVVLSDDRMEVTVDPARGGRILEILDKTIGGNQVHIDYDHLAGLDRVNFYYTLWDRVRAPGKYAIPPSAPAHAELLPDGIRMTTTSPAGMKLVKRLTLDGKGTPETGRDHGQWRNGIRRLFLVSASGIHGGRIRRSRDRRSASSNRRKRALHELLERTRQQAYAVLLRRMVESGGFRKESSSGADIRSEKIPYSASLVRTRLL